MKSIFLQRSVKIAAYVSWIWLGNIVAYKCALYITKATTMPYDFDIMLMAMCVISFVVLGITRFLDKQSVKKYVITSYFFATLVYFVKAIVDYLLFAK